VNSIQNLLVFNFDNLLKSDFIVKKISMSQILTCVLSR